jgi:hypothetical protein
MKKIILTVMVLSFSQLVFSQVNDTVNAKQHDEGIRTVFGDKETERGGFGALSFGMSDNVFGRNAVFTGARGGWIINHWFSFGLGGQSLLSGVHRDIGWDGPNPRSLEFYMGYGGIYIEPTAFPKFPIHLGFPVLLGAGGAVYVDELNSINPDYYTHGYWREDTDAFFVVEPGVDMEVNFVRNIRFSLGAKYRYITDLNLIETEADALNGLSYHFTIKIGKF